MRTIGVWALAMLAALALPACDDDPSAPDDGIAEIAFEADCPASEASCRASFSIISIDGNDGNDFTDTATFDGGTTWRSETRTLYHRVYPAQLGISTTNASEVRIIVDGRVVERDDCCASYQISETEDQ